MIPTTADFVALLEAKFREAEKSDVEGIEVNAGALHKEAHGGAYNDARMRSCCAAMRKVAVATDVVLQQPPKGNGSSLTYWYDIPRPDREIASTQLLETVEGEAVLPKAHQRIDAISNTHAGREFEQQAAEQLRRLGLKLTSNFGVSVGVGALRKAHRFDLGSANPPIIVECKSHRWTTGGNAPSAKLTVWNEAMYLFAASPIGFRKIFFVLSDYSETRRQTLAEHYVARYLHLIPLDVEIWEYDPIKDQSRVIDTHTARADALAQNLHVTQEGPVRIENDQV